MALLKKSAAVVVAALVGYFFGTRGYLGDPVESSFYGFLTSLLLAVGLVGSTRDIALRDLRRDIGTVVAALTIGVLAKAAIITAVMYAVLRTPAALVLGVVVAQIDPLSVAAMGRASKLSPRGRSILSLWASFDDPVTVVLTIYVSAWTRALADNAQSPGWSIGQLVGLVADLWWNCLFAGGAFVVWQLLRIVCRRLSLASPAQRPDQPVDAVARAGTVILLGGLVLVAAEYFLMLGLAIAGLFFRPWLGRVFDATTQVAFIVAAFVLGMLLVHGVDLGSGIVLGVAAVLAQAVVSLWFSRKLPRRDRAYLAAAQQNGVTAVILAVLLERDFPGTVGLVAPAIITINLIHGLWNAYLDYRYAGSEPSLEGNAGSVTGRCEYRGSTGPPIPMRPRSPMRPRPAER